MASIVPIAAKAPIVPITPKAPIFSSYSPYCPPSPPYKGPAHCSIKHCTAMHTLNGSTPGQGRQQTANRSAMSGPARGRRALNFWRRGVYWLLNYGWPGAFWFFKSGQQGSVGRRGICRALNFCRSGVYWPLNFGRPVRSLTLGDEGSVGS
jgi:hypothetical protein